MAGKYLPIGTVVMLKGGTKRVMITGFCSMSAEESNKVYDYSGCMFPEGYISSNEVALFNHDQIEVISYMGLKDAEEEQFKLKLSKLLEAYNNTQSIVNSTSQATLAPIVPETKISIEELVINSNDTKEA